MARRRGPAPRQKTRAQVPEQAMSKVASSLSSLIREWELPGFSKRLCANVSLTTGGKPSFATLTAPTRSLQEIVCKQSLRKGGHLIPGEAVCANPENPGTIVATQIARRPVVS